MAGDLRRGWLPGHLLVMQASVAPPALHAGAVARDGLSLYFPFRFPVGAFAGAGLEPGHAGGEGAVSVLAALSANGQGVDGFGVLEEPA